MSFSIQFGKSLYIDHLAGFRSAFSEVRLVDRSVSHLVALVMPPYFTAQ
jgi:hypothetical protein